MPTQHSSTKGERRRHIRIPGPLTAARVGDDEAPVQIVDLSEGGCFIESGDGHPELGRPIELKISFPSGHTVVVQGETLYARPGGYAVLFNRMSKATYLELERAVASVRKLKR
jgi:hypothetical protein